MSEVWKKCSVCKSDIGLGKKFFKCSVSSCNGKRTGYVFCSMPCWERHLPGARHRDAAAVEEVAPMVAETEVAAAAAPAPKRRIIASSPPRPASPATASMSSNQVSNHEILVVASKLKAYIKDRGDMNCAQSVLSKLSDYLRRECDRAMENARADGRKTVMDRDF